MAPFAAKQSCVFLLISQRRTKKKEKGERGEEKERSESESNEKPGIVIERGFRRGRSEEYKRGGREERVSCPDLPAAHTRLHCLCTLVVHSHLTSARNISSIDGVTLSWTKVSKENPKNKQNFKDVSILFRTSRRKDRKEKDRKKFLDKRPYRKNRKKDISSNRN